MRSVYDQCVTHLKRFRQGHMSIVADYIIAQQQQQQHQRGRKDLSLAQAKSAKSPKESTESDKTNQEKEAQSKAFPDTTEGESATSDGKPIFNTSGGKGTGGTDLLKFLKPIVDDCQRRCVFIVMQYSVAQVRCSYSVVKCFAGGFGWCSGLLATISHV
jgi:hypothetical protein